jgi:hypothetical protein
VALDEPAPAAPVPIPTATAIAATNGTARLRGKCRSRIDRLKLLESNSHSCNADAVRESAYLNCSKPLRLLHRVDWLGSFRTYVVGRLFEPLANHGTLRFIAAKTKRAAGTVVPARDPFHTEMRMQQGGIRDSDLTLLLSAATQVAPDAYLLSRADAAREITRRKREIQMLERLCGRKVVVDGGSILTCYHSRRRPKRTPAEHVVAALSQDNAGDQGSRLQ